MRIRTAFDIRMISRITYLLFLQGGHYPHMYTDRFSFGLSLSEVYVKIGNIRTDKELRNMLAFFKKEQQKHSIRNLRNLIEFTELANGEERKEIAKTLISAIADKMRVEAILGVVNQQETLDTSNVWDALFCREYDGTSDWRNAHESHKILRNMFKDSEQKLPQDKRFDLSDQPVIAIPWNYVGLKNVLGRIGTSQNQWRQIENNHAVTVILPIDIAVVTSGRHSICAGVQKRKGSLCIHSGLDNYHQQLAYDVSGLYNLVDFNGENYIWRTDQYRNIGKVAAKAANFDFGCIFELGRFLL